MDAFQKFALGWHLSDVPKDLDYDAILKRIEAQRWYEDPSDEEEGAPSLSVWEPFENWDAERLIESIDGMVYSLRQDFDAKPTAN